MARTTADQRELAAKHLAWKQHATGVIHRALDRRDLCYDADRTVNKAGLPVRARYDSNSRNARNLEAPVKYEDLVGEDTAEAFSTWRTRASRLLTIAVRSQLGSDAQAFDTLREAGFDVPNFVRKDVVVEGTFKIPMGTQDVPEGDDNVEDSIARTVVAERLHARLYYGEGEGEVEYTTKVAS